MPSSKENPIPVFGFPTVEYRIRRAAYAVIKDAEGRIAAVRGSSGYFLVGGGSLPGELPEQTVIREVREELARDAVIIHRIGEAVQYFPADGTHYRMEATFFLAGFTSEPDGRGEHELYWLALDQIPEPFFHQCHAWAVAQTSIAACD